MYICWAESDWVGKKIQIQIQMNVILEGPWVGIGTFFFFYPSIQTTLVIYPSPPSLNLEYFSYLLSMWGLFYFIVCVCEGKEALSLCKAWWGLN